MKATTLADEVLAYDQAHPREKGAGHDQEVIVEGWRWARWTKKAQAEQRARAKTTRRRR